MTAMNTVREQPMTPGRRRLHTALGTAAIAVTAVVTIVVGARTLGVATPSGDISTVCAAAGQCVQHIPGGPGLGTSLIQR